MTSRFSLGLGFAARPVSRMPVRILSKYVEISLGQSRLEYFFTRGQPRAALDYAPRLRDAFGFTATRAFAAYDNIVTDGVSKMAGDYTIKLINAASGGSALLDVAFGDASIPTLNYWWNTKNNTALTGNPLDIANSPAKLARDAYALIQAHGADALRWSQGGSDTAYLGASGPSGSLLYSDTAITLFQYLAGAAGKATLPTFVHRYGRHETNGDAGLQILRDMHVKWTQTYGWIVIGCDEYDLRLAVAGVVGNCSWAAGSQIINTANTSGLDMNDRIEAYGGEGQGGIDFNSYITAVNPGTAITISRPTLSSGSGVTLYRGDGTHFYPGSDGVQALDTDTNGDTAPDKHNALDGFYEMGRRMIVPTVQWMKYQVRKDAYGPRITGLMATAGNNYLEAVIGFDQDATALTNRMGNPIDINSKFLFAVTNNGANVAVTSFSYANGKIRLNVTPNLVGGPLTLTFAPGAMNRQDYRYFILDNGSVRRPLQPASPAANPAMSIILPTVPIAGALDSVMTGMVAQWDATVEQSYPGYEQAVSNIIAMPADGAGQNIYNLRLGNFSSVGSDDPSFNGTAGDPGAFFGFDGGDYFETYSNNTAFLNGLHKNSGDDWWFAIAYNIASNATAPLLSTISTTSAAGTYITSTSKSGGIGIQTTQRGDGGASSTNTTGRTYQAGQWVLGIVSFSKAQGLKREWLNNRTMVQSGQSFVTATTDATVNLHIGARNDNTSFWPAGSKFAGAAIGIGFLDDAGAAKLFDWYNARHGRVYG